MVGSAMFTTVASIAAIPDPSTVIATTHRPGAEDMTRAGASDVAISSLLERGAQQIAQLVIADSGDVRGPQPDGPLACDELRMAGREPRVMVPAVDRHAVLPGGDVETARAHPV